MTERERFEAYFKTRKDFVTLGSMFGDPLHKNEIGAYELPQARQSWETWQAATAQAVPEGYVLDQAIAICENLANEWDSDAVVSNKNYAGECASKIKAIKAAQEQNQ